MKNIILLDSEIRNHLLPLTYTRPIAELRCGILTISQKWELALKGMASHITENYLSEKFPLVPSDDNLVIDGSVLPTTAFCEKLTQLDFGQALLRDGKLLAIRINRKQLIDFIQNQSFNHNGTEIDIPIISISRIWHLFQQNREELLSDFERLTKDKKSSPLADTNQLIGDPSRIFIEEGASVECSILNVTDAPIYVGKNAEIMEGCMIKGGLALCDNAQLKMGTKIYGVTTIGPGCRGGGEISNSIMQANSNKGHDGFLGNSVVGEWCNLGADTNTSNLKNTYEAVKIWSYEEKRFVQSGQQFLGLIMGDHSKAGINTMFNTGTVVGVASNIFGSGFPRNFLPSFAWGGHEGLTTHRFEQAVRTAEIVCARRNINFGKLDSKILRHIFDATIEERVWDYKRP
ncbi:MAG: GlmU family protein [Saprospiraceae bacterium]